jgi:dolichol-phosphate mannosyltransferase
MYLMLESDMSSQSNIAVVIPSYKVKNTILDVISNITDRVNFVIVVDDGCPDQTGRFVKDNCFDPRISVIWNEVNLGVGGAMKSGYAKALSLGASVIVKIDGDGQMDPKEVDFLITPILEGKADYSKGNRFSNIRHIKRMPKLRIFGNIVLSFLAKFSTGYWKVFDPNNGYTAIASSALESIEIEKIDDGYFFESDMLYRLNLARAVVIDIPMVAKYGEEMSNLSIKRVVLEFPFKHLRNFVKRVISSYYVRDFTLASIELPVGLSLTIFGFTSGIINLVHSNQVSQATPTGTLILISMSVLVGIQFILSFFAYDIDSSPTHPISKRN